MISVYKFVPFHLIAFKCIICICDANIFISTVPDRINRLESKSCTEKDKIC